MIAFWLEIFQLIFMLSFVELFGDKTTALLDVWSFEHFISGASLGVLLLRPPSAISCPFDRLIWRFLPLVAASFAWECLEHYLELGLLGQDVAQWFAGVEHWSNRLLSDTTLVIIGAIAGERHRYLIPLARLASAVWLLAHLFAFPHSMYSHQVVLGIREELRIFSLGAEQ